MEKLSDFHLEVAGSEVWPRNTYNQPDLLVAFILAFTRPEFHRVTLNRNGDDVGLLFHTRAPVPVAGSPSLPPGHEIVDRYAFRFLPNNYMDSNVGSTARWSMVPSADLPTFLMILIGLNNHTMDLVSFLPGPGDTAVNLTLRRRS